MRRVVVTGMAGISALGFGLADDRGRRSVARQQRRAPHVATGIMYRDLNTRLAAPIEDFEPPGHWSRKQLRSMGRVSQLAVRAAELALDRCRPAGRPAAAVGQRGRGLRFVRRQHARTSAISRRCCSPATRPG